MDNGLYPLQDCYTVLCCLWQRTGNSMINAGVLMMKVNQDPSLDHLPLLPCLWVSMLEVVPPSHCSACCFRWGLGASSVFIFLLLLVPNILELLKNLFPSHPASKVDSDVGSSAQQSVPQLASSPGNHGRFNDHVWWLNNVIVWSLNHVTLQ